MGGGASLRVSLSAGCCAESLWMEGNKQSEKGTDDRVVPDSRLYFFVYMIDVKDTGRLTKGTEGVHRQHELHQTHGPSGARAFSPHPTIAGGARERRPEQLPKILTHRFLNVFLLQRQMVPSTDMFSHHLLLLCSPLRLHAYYELLQRQCFQHRVVSLAPPLSTGTTCGLYTINR